MRSSGRDKSRPFGDGRERRRGDDDEERRERRALRRRRAADDRRHDRGEERERHFRRSLHTRFDDLRDVDPDDWDEDDD